jgi:hypothetical protein
VQVEEDDVNSKQEEQEEVNAPIDRVPRRKLDGNLGRNFTRYLSSES